MIMAKKILSLLLIIAAPASLTACMPGAGPKQTAGHLVGAATGALIGSQFGHGSGRLVSVALGTLAGSYLGGILGNRMDQRDRELAQGAMIETLERAPDYGVRRWHNPNTEHSGNFRVTRTMEMPENNLVCRDYVHTVIIDGRQEKVHGRACRDVRDPKAAWMVEN